ncbi:MAG: hypothetical protein AAFV25_27225, partial [Bacteroidota bacterium]
ELDFHKNFVFAFEEEYSIISAYDEIGAKVIAKSKKIALILCDLSLQEVANIGSGKKLIEWINDNNKTVPTIAITSYYDEFNLEEEKNSPAVISIVSKNDYDSREWDNIFKMIIKMNSRLQDNGTPSTIFSELIKLIKINQIKTAFEKFEKIMSKEQNSEESLSYITMAIRSLNKLDKENHTETISENTYEFEKRKLVEKFLNYIQKEPIKKILTSHPSNFKDLS